jgi:small nuclear ribonucleoprotein (snRNP)-like protein
MEFSADKIAGSKVRCLTSSLDVYEGVLTGFDSAFNTTLQHAKVGPLDTTANLSANESNKAAEGSSEGTSTRLFVNGSRLLYVGFSE